MMREEMILNPEWTAEKLATLKPQELTLLYKERVGIDPTYRSFNDQEIIHGILDPRAERDRIAALDAESNKEERGRHWSNI